MWDEERRYRVRTKEKGTRQESEGEKGEYVGVGDVILISLVVADEFIHRATNFNRVLKYKIKL